jgi:hypothetical protein
METMIYPRTAIIILNWNGVADTVECLESLKKMTYPHYSIIVVDNGSDGDDVRILREKFGDYVHIIANDRNYGFAEGNNIGIRYALSKGTDYVFLLNNDTTVASDSLDEMVKAGESDARIGILGPKIYFYDKPDIIWGAGGKINWWLGAIRLRGYGEVDVGQWDNLAERDILSGAALLIKSELLEKISLLDSSFFFGFEDFDFCIRARRAGFRVVYVPKAKVWHKAGASRRKLGSPAIRKTDKRIRADWGIFGVRIRSKFFRKHSRRPPFPVPLVLYFLVYWPLRGAELFIYKKVASFLASSTRGSG